MTTQDAPLDPVDELAAVIDQTLHANALILTTSRGGYVGGGQPHATLTSSPGAVEAIARGLLARKVAEPSRAALAPSLDTPAPPSDFGEQIISKGGLPKDLARRIERIGSSSSEARDPAVQRLVEAARPLLEAIDAHDDANIHGWAAGVREALRHLEQEAGG